jgi:poly(A) polymerase
VIPERLEVALRPVLDAVAPLVDRFAAAGRRLYLVGGVVRDLLAGRALADRDIDLTTDARPDQIKDLLAGHVNTLWNQGERFGTIGAKLTGPDGTEWTVEITTHRADVYLPESRKPEVQFSDQVESDLSRRDFTVNAMALALPELQLIDPFDGAAHLAAGRLRTPLEPQESFSDDPLRMLRAARFLAGYRLTPSDELVRAVAGMGDRLAIVSAERVRDELDKLMVVEDPSDGLWFLVETGLADEFLPELLQMRLEQDPIHRHKDVLAHTIAVVANTSPDRLTRLAALFHDIGKPKTRSFGPNGVMFHHHEVVGARMTKDRMTALRYANDDVEIVTRLVRLHLRFHGYGTGTGWTDAAVRRFVRDAGDQLDRLIELTRCDCTTRNQRKAEMLARRMDHLVERIAALEVEEHVKSIRPDLDGRQVMDHLGLAPGREVGEALDMLLELRLDEGPLGTDEAFARLDQWWAERGD